MIILAIVSLILLIVAIGGITVTERFMRVR